MKKLMSICLALMVLLANAAFPVYAVDLCQKVEANIHRNLTYEELLQKAEYAFPEHAISSVTNSQMNTDTRGNELGLILLSETRRISDSELITYSEYSSGYSLYTYTVDVLLNSSSSGTGYSSANVDIYVYSPVLSGVLQVYNFAYTKAYSSYDSIQSTGRLGSNIIQSYLGRYKLMEDANGPAYALYTGVLENTILSSNVTIILEVTVGNDSCIQEVYG